MVVSLNAMIIKIKQLITYFVKLNKTSLLNFIAVNPSDIF